MAIVCGIDFSEPSMRAASAASQLAVRTKAPLHLVYSLDLGDEQVFEEPHESLHRWAERQLQRIADLLRASGAVVEIHVEKGSADEVLLETSKRLAAKLVVVAAVGRRQPDKWRLGSHADRIAQRSHVPVLVVRNPEPFEAWATGSRPLKVLVGVDSTAGSDAALRWVEELRSFGPCDVVAAHLYWPPPEFHRLGLAGVRSYLDPDPVVVRTLERDFSSRLPSKPDGMTGMRVEPHLGRLGDRLVEIAAEEHADLVVVGSHDRGPLARLWEGSVSRTVLHCARSSVACVPAPETMQARATPRIRRVLAATDLSSIGNAAVALAYSIVDDGGTVDLIHVLKQPVSDPLTPHDIFDAAGTTSESGNRARESLLTLVPVEAAVRCATEVYVLQSTRPAEAICQAAERLGADVLCLGTHGRTGLSKALLGSVAQSVLERTERPVLFTRGPR